jgi:hypothetical protein
VEAVRAVARTQAQPVASPDLRRPSGAVFVAPSTGRHHISIRDVTHEDAPDVLRGGGWDRFGGQALDKPRDHDAKHIARPGRSRVTCGPGWSQQRFDSTAGDMTNEMGISKQVWESKRNGDVWFSLSDDGTLLFNRVLPPAPPVEGESGTRMPRTDGIGIVLNIEDLASLAMAASKLAPQRHWLMREREMRAAKEEARKAWLRNQARSLGTSE